MSLNERLHELAKLVFIHVFFGTIRVFTASTVVVNEPLCVTIFQQLKFVLGSDISTTLAAFQEPTKCESL